jgi:hypothetical protein
MKKGSKVYLKNPFWHNNTNLGGKKALVLSTNSYILVKVYDYHSNPVKCFRSEISDKPTELEKPNLKKSEPSRRTDYERLQNHLDKSRDDRNWNSWIK